MKRASPEPPEAGSGPEAAATAATDERSAKSPRAEESAGDEQCHTKRSPGTSRAEMTTQSPGGSPATMANNDGAAAVETPTAQSAASPTVQSTAVAPSSPRDEEAVPLVPPKADNTKDVKYMPVPQRAAKDALESLWESGAFFDVVLRVKADQAKDDLRVPASRLVLSAHSPFFRQMFTTEMAESKVGAEVVLEEIDPPALTAVIRSFYSARGDVALSPGTVTHVIRTASRLQCLAVEKTSVNFFCSCLEPDTAAAALCFAMELGATGSPPSKDLVRRCTAFACEHFKSVAQQSEFLDLSEDTVRTLLESDTLECGEEVAFAALMSWIKKDEGTRAEALERLVPLIRFPQMLPADLSAVCTEPLLGNLPASLLMPLMAGEHHRLQTILALFAVAHTDGAVFQSACRGRGSSATALG